MQILLSLFSYIKPTPYAKTSNFSYGISDFANDVLKIYQPEKTESAPFIESNIISTQQNWITVFCLIALTLLAYAFAYQRKRMKLLFNALVNKNIAKQILRYEKVYTHQANLILAGMFLICCPLFFSLCTLHNSFSLESWTLILAIFILVFYLLKFLFHFLLAYTLKLENLITEFFFHYTLTYKILGVIYFAGIVLALFSNIPKTSLLYFGLSAFAIGTTFQLLKGFKIGVSNNQPLLLIILYLCTLEILPWLWVGKFLSNYIQIS